MKEDAHLWAWVGGATALIVVVLGVWWWHVERTSPSEEISYDTTTTSAEALQSPDAPTLPVPIETLPTTTYTQGHTTAVSTTVVGIIGALGNTSRFATLLSETGVTSQLSGKGPYTVFVPTNASFTLLPPGSLNLTTTQLKRLVEYHIVANTEIDVNAQSTGTEEALSGDMLNFSVFANDKSARINSAVALKEYKASNGIVYVISEVLVPPANP